MLLLSLSSFMESIGTVLWHSCCSRDCLVHHFTSLLVRNIPRDCRSDELRMPFEHFGPLKDVYLPKNYYTGEPHGFGFVQFIDPQDAVEAQYHMHGQYIGGREITIVLAEENRKNPNEMRVRTRARVP